MRDLVVVSDLHIGRGRSPTTRRFHALETFFFDEDLRQFLAWAGEQAAARGTTLRAVFNGDTFDFLRMEADLVTSASRREQRFGADLTPATCAELVREILAGHPVFVEALADVLARGGEVVVLPGNHDLEVQWTPVQDELRRAVRGALAGRDGLGAAGADGAVSRLLFRPWFHYEPGRIWIEHGCQYDPENAYRYPLRTGLSDGRYDSQLLELDMPLGNFFQKYLYNGFGPLTFIVPSTRANARYSRWMLFNEPRLMFRVALSHAPFAWQAVRRLARRGIENRMPLERAHDAELARLAEESGLGERLRRIDGLKTVRGDLLHAAREYGLQAARVLAGVLATALVGAGAWSGGLFAIDSLAGGLGLKALLFLGLNFLLLAAALGTVGYLVLRDDAPANPWPQRRAAGELARLLDVPVVTFGHTHEEVVWPVERQGGGWYYNTGTWVAVFTHDVLLPRERVQFTFLHVQGGEAELKYWSPGRREALPVVLLDEEPAPARPTA
jgi:UDP-2,3-diacylglucosamine pyrophosphatase LpxH